MIVQKALFKVRVTDLPPLWLTVILATGAGSALAADPAPADTHKAFAADEVKLVDIRTEQGRIKVQGSDLLTIQVDLLDNVDSKKCRITMEPDPDKKILMLEVKSTGLFSSSDCHTGFSVELPKFLNVHAASGRGDIEAAGLKGDLSADDGTGDIRLSDLRGDVKAHTGTGEVSGNIKAENGVNVETGTGQVDLKGLVGGLKVNTGTGKIRLEWATAPSLKTKARAELRTGAASAAVYFPGESKIRADLQSGVGRLNNELGDTPGAAFTLSMKSGTGNLSVFKTKGAAPQ
jgi:hypothetical protein